MSEPRRVYLDNAATSWPKPDSVFRALERAMRELGAPAGRGAYREAADVAAIVLAARQRIVQLIGGKDPRRIAFTLNGTDALNQAIHGALADGGHVVTTVVEHNSVLRPLRRLEDLGLTRVTRVGCDANGFVDPGDVQKALRSDTRLVVVVHASNVTGAIQPVEQIGQMVRGHGALFLLDAAQTLGELPIDVERMNVDLLAAPGHKGLLGPLGTGVLYVRPGVEGRIASTRQGGTGSQSENDRHPDVLPEKFEAGNLNVPGIAGLGASAAWVLERGVHAIRREAVALTERLINGLSAIDGCTLYGPEESARRVGLVSMRLRGYDPQELAATLDAAFRVQTRAGLHCSPLTHAALATLDGGTVRFSFGPYNTADDVDAAIAAVAEIAAAGPFH